MLNLFQHLAVSMGYETLKQVQGDIPVIYTQTLVSIFSKKIKLKMACIIISGTIIAFT
jgi:hypothetical protein